MRPAHMPAHSLNLTRESSAMQCLSMTSSSTYRWYSRSWEPFSLESVLDLEKCRRRGSPHHATSHLQSRLESQHQSVPGCAEECGDPGCGSRTRRWPTSRKRPRLGFRRSATTLYPSPTAPLLPQLEPAGLLRLVIRREHHQHDLPQHQSQPDRRHPPSIRRAPAGACGKDMLPVSDPYRGSD